MTNNSMNKLKVLRAESGFSLRELATKSGVDQSTISLIENDRQKAQIITLGKLARVLGEALGRHITVEDLAELVDHSASLRGRKGGTPSHKSRQGQDEFKAATTAANFVPVSVPAEQIADILATMETGKPPAERPKAKKPRLDIQDKQHFMRLATEFNLSYGMVKRSIQAIPDYRSLSFEDLRAVVAAKYKKEDVVEG
jgi:transcriptional regulator with XRE-family HTH domain